MGYIYKLVCNITNEVYYGKSTMKYPRRLYYHKSCPKGSSGTIIERGNYNFILVEDNIEDLIELTNKEYYYITNFECINMTIPFTTEDNELKRNNEHAKRYYYENKESILQQRKVFNEANKERLNSEKRKIIECNCGKSYTKTNQARHLKSEIHKKYLDSIC